MAMVKLDSTEISVMKEKRITRELKLAIMMSQTFDIRNSEHMAILKTYLDDYEYKIHELSLFQALSAFATPWLLSFAVARVVYIPEFIASLLTMGLCVGVTAVMLHRRLKNEFEVHHAQMEEIYNWCLKGNRMDYDERTDNTEKLNHIEMQRLITLLASHSKIEFLRVWQPVIPLAPLPQTSTEKPGTVYRFFSGAVAVASAAVSTVTDMMPSSSPEESDQLKALKIKVEQGSLNINTYDKADRAIHYFWQLDYKPIIKEMINSWREHLEQITPEVITSSLMHLKRP